MGMYVVQLQVTIVGMIMEVDGLLLDMDLYFVSISNFHIGFEF